MFYISAHFETHRDAYYERLLAVSRDNEWTGWCRFFLEAIRAQAEDKLGRPACSRDACEDTSGTRPWPRGARHSVLTTYGCAGLPVRAADDDGDADARVPKRSLNPPIPSGRARR